MKIETPETPALIDAIILTANTQLKSRLSWLTEAYGRVQLLTRQDSTNTRRYNPTAKYPAIYTGRGKEYASMLPTESLGNFSFWDIGGNYKVDWKSTRAGVITANFGIVYWMNLTKTLPAGELRNLELLKEEILTAVALLRVPEARFNVTEVTEKAEEIYRGYTVNEKEQQFLMHPFAGLRFNGVLTFEKLCR